MSASQSPAPRKRRKRKKPRGKDSIVPGRAITPLQIELIVQAYALCGNKSQVAREVGCSVPTVNKALKLAESDRSLQKARARTLDEMAGRIHSKATEIIESIHDEDLESGLIKTFDDDGNLKSAKSYGPSLMQKVTSAAIFADKLKVLAETKEALLADQTSGDAMPLPGELQASLKLLGQKVKALRVLDIQFADKHDETANKLQDTATAAALHPDVEEADYEDVVPSFDDFDNPQ